MYMPPYFEETNHDEIVKLIKTYPLATLIAQSQSGLIANHIPLLLSDSYLIGHIALKNPLHNLVAEGAEVLSIFTGEEAYISPNWYPSKAEHHRQVPTWNYRAVHVYGKITFQHDQKTKLSIVGKLTKHHEEGLTDHFPWRMADAPRDYLDEMIDNIVAFKIQITRSLAKAKLNQNKSKADMEAVATELQKRGNDKIATEMKKRLIK